VLFVTPFCYESDYLGAVAHKDSLKSDYLGAVAHKDSLKYHDFFASRYQNSINRFLLIFLAFIEESKSYWNL
jgi:hypothetical protein